MRLYLAATAHVIVVKPSKRECACGRHELHRDDTFEIVLIRESLLIDHPLAGADIQHVAMYSCTVESLTPSELKVPDRRKH